MKGFLFIVSAMMLFISCKRHREEKSISVFLDPSGAMKIKKRHIAVYLNNNKLTDTTINNEDVHPDIGKVIKCFNIDSLEKNELTIDINSRKLQINLNKYKSTCINIHAVYDDITVINNLIKEADQQAIVTTFKTIDIKNFVDSLIAANPKKKFDTIMYQVDLRNCPCKTN